MFSPPGPKGGTAVTEVIALLSVVSPAPHTVWQEVFDRDAEAVPYQSPLWTDALCRSDHRRDASRFYTFSDGTQMVLPVVEHRWVPAAVDLAGSMPWGWGMGGLVSTSTVRAEHVRAVIDDLTTHARYLRLSIRPNPRAGDVWKAAMPAGVRRVARLAHAIDLEGGFDTVWHTRFSASTRKYVTRAEEAGVVVECDDRGRLVPAYYDLFRRATQRWAAQQHEPLLLARLRGYRRDPEQKFATIAQTLRGACRMYVAFVDGQPAAACLILCYQNVNAARVVLDRERVGRSGAPDLMMKRAIEDACKAGCRYFHQGESGTSKGIADFKRRLGGTAYAHEEYYLERLPVTAVDHGLRTGVKKLIKFKDLGPASERSRRRQASGCPPRRAGPGQAARDSEKPAHGGHVREAHCSPRAGRCPLPPAAGCGNRSRLMAATHLYARTGARPSGQWWGRWDLNPHCNDPKSFASCHWATAPSC
jgi:Acetyltransferase (GNAT) domain